MLETIYSLTSSWHRALQDPRPRNFIGRLCPVSSWAPKKFVVALTDWGIELEHLSKLVQRLSEDQEVAEIRHVLAARALGRSARARDHRGDAESVAGGFAGCAEM